MSDVGSSDSTAVASRDRSTGETHRSLDFARSRSLVTSARSRGGRGGVDGQWVREAREEEGSKHP